MPVTRAISQPLDTTGDGTGTKDAAVNGSVTPVEFKITHATRTFCVTRLIVHIEDDGNFTATSYGSIATLANGVEIEHQSDGGTTDLLGGLPITAHTEYQRIAFDVSERPASGGGDKTVVARWTFGKFVNIPYGLVVEPGDALCVRINDDLTALTEHYFWAQGAYVE